MVAWCVEGRAGQSAKVQDSFSIYNIGVARIDIFSIFCKKKYHIVF